MSHFMPIQNLNLWHGPNDLHPIVRLLRQRIAEKVQLLKEWELLKELKEVVQITQLIVPDEEDAQEIETLDARDALEFVTLAVHLFDSEVWTDAVQVFEL